MSDIKRKEGERNELCTSIVWLKTAKEWRYQAAYQTYLASGRYIKHWRCSSLNNGWNIAFLFWPFDYYICSLERRCQALFFYREKLGHEASKMLRMQLLDKYVKIASMFWAETLLGRAWVSPTLVWLHCKTRVYVQYDRPYTEYLNGYDFAHVLHTECERQIASWAIGKGYC